MANYKNTKYFLVTGKQTVPESTSGTGTIETTGTAVIGTGTSFTTQMTPGAWLVDLGQDELRKVIKVASDTLAYVDVAFTSNIAALTTPNIIPAKNVGVVTIAGQIPAGQADGELDGEIFYAGTSFSFSKDSRDHSSARDLVDPVIVDGSGTIIQILTQN